MVLSHKGKELIELLALTVERTFLIQVFDRKTINEGQFEIVLNDGCKFTVMDCTPEGSFRLSTPSGFDCEYKYLHKGAWVEKIEYVGGISEFKPLVTSDQFDEIYREQEKLWSWRGYDEFKREFLQPKTAGSDLELYYIESYMNDPKI